jgi:hypothetical protein
MNCYNHPEEVSVATCIDCGKGLCKNCAGLYQVPICNECNLKRTKSEKTNILKIYIPSIIMFFIGFFFCFSLMSSNNANTSVKIFTSLVGGYIFAGVPWGWKAISFIQPRMFLFLSGFGWLLYFMIKFFLSYFIGLVALPIGIIKLIKDLLSAKSKKDNIINNLKES